MSSVELLESVMEDFHTHSRSLIQPLHILQRNAFAFSTFSMNRSIVSRDK
jgi:hypothetical protein